MAAGVSAVSGGAGPVSVDCRRCRSGGYAT